MREKFQRVVVTFRSTTDAIAMERFCTQNSVPGRLIPVPRQISASCGMAWSAPAEEKQAVMEACAAAKIAYEQSYELLI